MKWDCLEVDICKAQRSDAFTYNTSNWIIGGKKRDRGLDFCLGAITEGTQNELSFFFFFPSYQLVNGMNFAMNGGIADLIWVTDQE